MLVAAADMGVAVGSGTLRVMPRRPAVADHRPARTRTTIAEVAVVAAAGSEIRKAMPRRRVTAGRTTIAVATGNSTARENMVMQIPCVDHTAHSAGGSPRTAGSHALRRNAGLTIVVTGKVGRI